MTLRIAHLSDLHVLDLAGTSPLRFLNKRATGVANLLGARRDAHPLRIADKLSPTLGSDGLNVDHVLITGDLSNLALESEFARARTVVEAIGGPERVTVVPGNHDVYTGGATRAARFEQFFAPWMVPLPAQADDISRAQAAGRAHYPFAKTIAPGVRVYGLSSAIPAPPLFAWGEVGDAQLARLRDLVATEPKDGAAAVHTRIVMVHHNLHPRSGIAEQTARLRDRDALIQTLKDVDATVLLHGHTHPPQQHWIDGPSKTWVLGCGSSTWFKPTHAHHARLNVLTFDGPAGLVEAQAHEWSEGQKTFLPLTDDLLSRATASAPLG